MLRCTSTKCFVFQIKGAQKSQGGIYTARKGYTEYLDICPVWIAQIGSECPMADELDTGDVVLIRDHFELEEIPGLWEHYRDDPRFKLLKDRTEEVDGYVSTSLIETSGFLAKVDLQDRGAMGTKVTFGSGEIGDFVVGV